MPLPSPASYEPSASSYCPVGNVADDSLLGSIRNRPEIAKRFEQQPVDMRTIALPNDSFQSRNRRSTPVKKANPSLFETIDLEMDVSPSLKVPSSQKSIPCRRIGDLGSKPGEEVDYRFVSELGAGGSGIVFQAHQRAVDREVAVKMLRSELAAQPHSRERFLAEARVIGRLDHPNVIALHEVYSDETGALFYSMKNIDGTSWDEQIAHLSQTRNIEILLRVSDAIRYAHSRGLIHRDIKPENVMLGKFGEVLLADWGLAISNREQDSVVIPTESVGGTPAYMAPELASASVGSITFQTDVYLLGAILYQILTGKTPHQGKSLLQCIHAAANNLIEPSTNKSELMEIAMRAMATNPSDRYVNVEDFMGAIENQRQHEQSERLLQRALFQVESTKELIDNNEAYQNFGIADALLAEAIRAWPENVKAKETRQRLQLQFATLATERGDYDLAADLYEAAGAGESEEAEMVQFHRLRRDASKVQVSRYSVLFTQLPDPGLLTNWNHQTIVESNLAFAELFGYMDDQIAGQSIEDLEIWALPTEQDEHNRRVREQGVVHHFDAWIRHADGREIKVTVQSRLVEVLGEKMLLSTFREKHPA